MGWTDAISQLAQTTMRSEIGAMTLDQSLKERAMLNARITQAVNEATDDWGVRVMRCTYIATISLHRSRSSLTLS